MWLLVLAFQGAGGWCVLWWWVSLLAVSSGRIIRYCNTFLGFPDGSAGKESACNAGDAGSIPESERTAEEEMATQYSCLENFTDRGAW